MWTHLYERDIQPVRLLKDCCLSMLIKCKTLAQLKHLLARYSYFHEQRPAFPIWGLATWIEPVAGTLSAGTDQTPGRVPSSSHP